MLTLSLPSDREIRIERVFNAPPELVWEAHTQPNLIRRWMLGPPGWEMPVCTLDLRVGGKYRYEWEDKGRGKRMGLGGVFTEVAAPARLGSREKFDDDWTGGETQNLQVFTARDGGTLSVLTVLYASKEARDGAAASGMSDGMDAAYRRLDDILRETR